MAIVHPDADITPSKQELLAAWLPTRPWWPGGDPGAEVETAGSFRFDDPDGEVGVETILVRAGGDIVQAPLTYRGAPLEGADEHLITTMEHTVLGRRWIYDGCGDPVWASVTAAVVLTGGSEASLEVSSDGETKEFPSRTSAKGSGTAGAPVAETGTPCPRDEGATTVVEAGPYVITVARVAGADVGPGETLTVGPRDGEPFVAAAVQGA
ncbi:CG0192-related protein [Nocardioides bigeumensis]|uniref:Maltokinase N-terminal cap domain-containing protein n=1 Tax=Nocardioides bigeumensis TaxID=433657 RepID=A0ABN2Y7L8_9ACTN